MSVWHDEGEFDEIEDRENWRQTLRNLGLDLAMAAAAVAMVGIVFYGARFV